MRTAHRLAAVVPAAAAVILGAGFATCPVATAAPLGAAAAATPDRPLSCVPISQTYKVTKWDTIDLGDGRSGAWGWAHNRTGRQATFTVSLSTDSQVTYNIDATVSVEAGIIFANAAATVGGGISYSHTDSIDKSLSITVPAHEFGVIGVDNVYYRFWGTYSFYYSNCKASHYKNVAAEFPSTEPQGLEGRDIKHVPTKPPWPLAPGT
jgi:hypothetical protein